MTWVSSEKAMIQGDEWREAGLISGSQKMLKSLWKQHPRILRIAYSQGRARTTREAMLERELKQARQKMSDKAYCISDKIEVRKRITPAEVSVIIKIEEQSRQPETGKRLVQSVADCFSITYGELIGDGRARRYVEARVVVVAVLRERGWSFPKIGRLLGGRDHSTICHAMNIFETYARRNPMVVKLFQRFRPDVVVI